MSIAEIYHLIVSQQLTERKPIYQDTLINDKVPETKITM